MNIIRGELIVVRSGMETVHKLRDLEETIDDMDTALDDGMSYWKADRLVQEIRDDLVQVGVLHALGNELNSHPDAAPILFQAATRGAARDLADAALKAGAHWTGETR